MLTLKQRKKYLQDLGFQGTYRDMVFKAKLKYQTHVPKNKLYGQSTDRMLVTAHRMLQAPHFNPREIACGCGGKFCNGYPAYFNKDLLEDMETIRTKFGKPMTITSGLRCKKYNASTSGSSTVSMHMKGKAIDFYIPEICDTQAGRLKVINYLKKLSHYGYAYCNVNGNHPNMGNAIHYNVK